LPGRATPAPAIASAVDNPTIFFALLIMTSLWPKSLR
jgi:hypothetical protein